MARTYTRSELRTRIRQLADMESSRLVADAELNDWLDTALAEFYELLYQSGIAYAEKSKDIVTTGGDSYTLPADFLGFLKLEYRVTTSPLRYCPLRAVSILEDHKLTGDGQQAVGYRLVNNTVQLYPTPPEGQLYRLRYVPIFAKLTADSGNGGIVEGYNGWEQLPVIDCVIKCLLKEESDAAPWFAERERLRERIREAAEDRSLTDGGRIVDVSSDYDMDPTDLDYRRRVPGWW